MCVSTGVLSYSVETLIFSHSLFLSLSLAAFFWHTDYVQFVIVLCGAFIMPSYSLALDESVWQTQFKYDATTSRAILQWLYSYMPNKNQINFRFEYLFSSWLNFLLFVQCLCPFFLSLSLSPSVRRSENEEFKCDTLCTHQVFEAYVCVIFQRLVCTVNRKPNILHRVPYSSKCTRKRTSKSEENGTWIKKMEFKWEKENLVPWLRMEIDDVECSRCYYGKMVRCLMHGECIRIKNIEMRA